MYVLVCQRRRGRRGREGGGAAIKKVDVFNMCSRHLSVWLSCLYYTQHGFRICKVSHLKGVGRYAVTAGIGHVTILFSILHISLMHVFLMIFGVSCELPSK